MTTTRKNTKATTKANANANATHAKILDAIPDDKRDIATSILGKIDVTKSNDARMSKKAEGMDANARHARILSLLVDLSNAPKGSNDKKKIRRNLRNLGHRTALQGFAPSE